MGIIGTSLKIAGEIVDAADLDDFITKKGQELGLELAKQKTAGWLNRMVSSNSSELSRQVIEKFKPLCTDQTISNSIISKRKEIRENSLRVFFARLIAHERNYIGVISIPREVVKTIVSEEIFQMFSGAEGAKPIFKQYLEDLEFEIIAEFLAEFIGLSEIDDLDFGSEVKTSGVLSRSVVGLKINNRENPLSGNMEFFHIFCLNKNSIWGEDIQKGHIFVASADRDLNSGDVDDLNDCVRGIDQQILENGSQGVVEHLIAVYRENEHLKYDKVKFLSRRFRC